MEPTDGLLTIDCGNSTIDCLWHVEGSRQRFPSSLADIDDVVAWSRSRTPRACVVASVVVSLGDSLVAALRAAGLPTLRVGSDLPCPLRLAYADPASLGVDRWLAAVGAQATYGAAVVIDCGTATTVNLVSADGLFVGGCIGPGLRAIEVGMRSTTPALPTSRLDHSVVFPATDTQAAVDAGVLIGYAGMVERFAAHGVRVLGTSCTVVLTGGNAARVVPHTRLRARCEPDLVHQGMRRLIEGPPCSA